ncbi:MAG TPA: Uma2 family endonuclease [Ktedonobacteraceae bacterium]
MKTLHWTSRDLELLPDDGNRYEIIDGELYVAKQPDWQHQLVGFRLGFLLEVWNEQSQAGLVNLTPGIIFADDTNVVPDVVWISQERLKTALHKDGKLHYAPELVVEVLSPGTENERRDREVKLKLYSRRNVKEYWVVNWRERILEIYRREDAVLTLEKTLEETDVLQSPLLPGFSCKVSQFFTNL